MSQERKETGEEVSYNPHLQYDPQPHYGTFQGVANYPPQPAVLGFLPPAPPPGAAPSPGAPALPQYYPHHVYQPYPGYPIAEGRPLIERPGFCCGCGKGWFLFIIGFFLAAIPWYIGAIILLCSRSVNYRDKTGYIACTIAAVVTTIFIIFGSADDDWYDW